MPYRWESRENLKSSIRSSGLWGHILWFIGFICAILGIIGDATNTNLGLEPTSWLLLAIVTCLVAIACFIAWALAVFWLPWKPRITLEQNEQSSLQSCLTWEFLSIVEFCSYIHGRLSRSVQGRRLLPSL